MKRIFFLLGAMNVGGVEKAFLNMLPHIPRDKYEIHLGLLSYKGGYIDEIPEYVKVHRIECYDRYKSVINDPPLSVIKGMFGRGEYIGGLIHLLLYVHFRMTGSRIWLYRYMLKDEPCLPGKFDLAVAYAGPSQAVDYYISEKVCAERKCGWVHFDVTKFGIDRGMTKRLYRNYDRIFLVSETAKEKFDALFPELKDRTEVFYNIVSGERIRVQAVSAPSFDDDFGGKRILTVGRISEEKGQDHAIRALRILLDKGYDVKWYFVGDGAFRRQCERIARDLDVEESVCFLGVQKNPYGYMRDCDVYVQPSRHEGYCITLAEARVFDSPIVATCFTGAREQLRSRKNGFVTGFSADEMAEGITHAMEYIETGCSETEENASGVKYSGPNDIEKLMELLK